MLSRTSQFILIGAAAAAAILGAAILGAGSVRVPLPALTPAPTPPASAAAEGTPVASLSFTGQIAFDRTVDGNTDLYLMNVDGSGLQRLTSDPDEDSQPAWSPDGAVLFFTRRIGPESANKADLYALEVASGKLARLTSSPGVEADPKISPDGTQIAYDRWPDEPGTYVMNRDGSNNRLIHRPASVDEGLIGWDSNASVVMFTSPNRIVRVDIATGAATTLVDSQTVRADGAFLAPDGRQIAFKGTRAPYGVVVANLDGSNQSYVADGGARGSIGWSPDGRYLIFINAVDARFYIVGVHGSDLIPWAEGHFWAAWRPGS